MVNMIKTIAKNSGYVLISNIIAGLLTLAINIYIARYLGKEIFGNYSFVLVFISFFIIIANLGIDSIVIREISANKKATEKYINSALTLKFILSGISIILTCITISFLPYTQSVKLGVIVASVTLILLASTATMSAYFQSRLEMIYVAISNVIAKLVFAILIWYVVITNGGFIKLVAASVVGLLIQSLLIFYILRKNIRIKICFDKNFNKKMIKESLPLALMGVFVSLYYRVDVLMLSLMKDEAAIGMYSAAYNLTEAPTIIAVGFMVSMFPLMSQYFKNSKNKLKKSYELSVKYMFLIALPLSVGTTLLNKEIIQIIYGSEYAPSALALAVLIWSTLLVFIGVINGNMLVAIKKQNVFSIVTGIALVANILINLWLIPKYSFIGASVATLITELIFLTITTHIIFRYLNGIAFTGIIQTILATMGMGVFVYFVKTYIILEILGAIFVYAALVFILRAVTKEDIEIIKKAIGK